MTQQYLQIWQQHDILRIRLTRPAQLNALNLQMCVGISKALAELDTEQVRAVVFDSDHPRAFCAGGDVREIVADPAAAQNFLFHEYAMNLAIASCPVPTFALVNGIVMGGGLGIAAHAQHRVVTASSRVAMPEVQIGIVPDVGMNRLLAQMPTGCGQLLAATGCEITGGQAVDCGFFDYLVADSDYSAFTGEIATAKAAQLTEIVQCYQQEVAAGEFARQAAAIYERYQQLLAAGKENQLTAFSEALRLAGANEYSKLLAAASPVAAYLALLRVENLRHKLTLDTDYTPFTALCADLRLVSQLVADSNFRVGVQARLVSKDPLPKWRVSNLEAEYAAARQLAQII